MFRSSRSDKLFQEEGIILWNIRDFSLESGFFQFEEISSKIHHIYLKVHCSHIPKRILFAPPFSFGDAHTYGTRLLLLGVFCMYHVPPIHFHFSPVIASCSHRSSLAYLPLSVFCGIQKIFSTCFCVHLQIVAQAVTLQLFFAASVAWASATQALIASAIKVERFFMEMD